MIELCEACLLSTSVSLSFDVLYISFSFASFKASSYGVTSP